MTKKDIKNLMVVVLETKEYGPYLVVDDIIISKDGYMNLCEYNDDLTFPEKKWSITKVYEPQGFGLGFSVLENLEGVKLIWERQPKRKVTYELTDEQIKNFEKFLGIKHLEVK
jgi:hypothetical protein